MKCNVLLAVLSLVAICAAQSLDNNWNGWGDTSQVNGFQGTGTVYSQVNKLSAWENSVFDVYAQDTVNKAGAITGQSVNFMWGIQYMHPNWGSTYRTTSYTYSDPLVIDICNLAGSGVFTKTNTFLQSDGSYTQNLELIDTISMSKWAVQSRAFSPQWDVFYRFWAKGITGNQATTYVKLIFAQVRRGAVNTRGK